MKILVLPGDGIGPEITRATLTVLDHASGKFRLGLEWRHEEIFRTKPPSSRAASGSRAR